MPKTTPGGKALLRASKEYRKAQNAQARANRERKAAACEQKQDSQG